MRHHPAQPTAVPAAATVPDTPLAAGPAPPGPGRAVGAVAPAVILVIGMVAAVNLAIPKLQASGLHPSVSATAWVVDSYTLVFACLLIPAGALGDRFGRKRGMLLGLALFAAGSILAAVAPDVAVLMAGRAVSGVGAALVLPATLAVPLGQVEPASRPRAVALWSSLTGIGGVAGNLGGGLAVEFGGWRVLFWAGLPIALAAAALIGVRVPSQARHQDPVDGGGAVLLTAGSVALLFGVIDGPQDGWVSWPVIGSLLLEVALLAAFVLYELRRPHPMLDPRLFRLAGVRVGALGIVALFFALFGLFYLNAQYLQDAKGYSPLLTGVAILPVAVVMPVISARSGQVAARLGDRATIVTGLLTLVTGLTLLSLASATTPYWAYGLLLAMVSAGMGLAMPPLSGMIVHALPPSHAGVSSGLNSTTRELGSALGVAVLGTILTVHVGRRLSPAIYHLPAARDAFVSGFGVGLRVGAALLLVVTAVVLWQHPECRRPAGRGRGGRAARRG